MTQIKISIDCDGKYCKGCDKLIEDIKLCPVFHAYLRVDKAMPSFDVGAFAYPNFLRCPQCLAATVEE